MAFTKPNTGDVVAATHITQLTNALDGTTGAGQPIKAIALNDASEYALSVRNLDATNSRALQVLKHDNTVLLQVDIDGVLATLAEGTTFPASVQDVLDAMESEGLGALSNVDLTGVTDGDTLLYDGTETEWIRTPLALASLNDATISTPTDGQVLAYDGTAEKWENQSLVQASTSSAYATASQSLTAGSWVAVLSLADVVVPNTASLIVFANVRLGSSSGFGQSFQVRARVGTTESDETYVQSIQSSTNLAFHFFFSSVAAGTYTVYLDVQSDSSATAATTRRLTALVLA